MPNKTVTVINFQCKEKDCGHFAGMLIAVIPEGKNKEDIRCPKCKSSNITYETML